MCSGLGAQAQQKRVRGRRRTRGKKGQCFAGTQTVADQLFLGKHLQTNYSSQVHAGSGSVVMAELLPGFPSQSLSGQIWFSIVWSP